MARLSTPTLAEHAATFMRLRSEDWTPRTIEAYDGALRRDILPTFGERHLSSIRRGEVKNWHDELRYGKGQPTSERGFMLLRQILDDAAEREYIRENPARVRNYAKRGKRTVKEFTKEDFFKVLRWMPTEYHAPCFVALSAALRPAEICGLSLGDWNPETRVLHVNQQWQDHRLRPPKWGSAGYVYPLSMGAEILDDLHGNRSYFATDASAFFPARNRWGRMDPSYISTTWTKAAKAARLEGFTLHKIRAVGLTTYAQESGCTVAEQLAHGRHKDISVAMLYQNAADLDRRRELSQRASERLKAVKGESIE
jgi:integrase